MQNGKLFELYSQLIHDDDINPDADVTYQQSIFYHQIETTPNCFANDVIHWIILQIFLTKIGNVVYIFYPNWPTNMYADMFIIWETVFPDVLSTQSLKLWNILGNIACTVHNNTRPHLKLFWQQASHGTRKGIPGIRDFRYIDNTIRNQKLFSQMAENVCVEHASFTNLSKDPVPSRKEPT